MHNVEEIIHITGSNALNAEVEVLSDTDRDGYRIREIYLSLNVLPDTRIKLYCWTANPIDCSQKVPGIIHIHGGGQTAYMTHAEHWAKKGYACISYDYTGKYEGREKFSDISGLPDGWINVDFNVENSILLSRIIIAKAVLSWFITNKNVDPERIGVYGVSWGGTITWLLNSYDNRIKAACAIYGCGDHTLPGRIMNIGVVKNAAMEENWRKFFDPSMRATRQNAPLLMMQATNDFWGWMDSTARNLGRIPDGKYSCYFTPNQDHHLDKYRLTTLDKWFEIHFDYHEKRLKNPELKITNRKEHVICEITADNRYEVQRVSICYSLQDYHEKPSPARFWSEIEAQNNNGTYEGEIPVDFCNEIIIVFACVIYNNDLKLCTIPASFIPSQIGVSHATHKINSILSDFSKGTDGWTCMKRYADPINGKPFEYRNFQEPDGKWGLTYTSADGFSLSTMKIGDLRWIRHRKSSSLLLSLKGKENYPFFITLSARVSQQGLKEWKNIIPAVDGWLEIELGLDDFTDKDIKKPPCWSVIDCITVECTCGTDQKNTPAIGKVMWLD